MLLASPSPRPSATFGVRFQNFMLHPSQAPPSHSFMYQASKSHSAPSSKIFLCETLTPIASSCDAHKNFFSDSEFFTRLGSSITFKLRCIAHIFVSRKLCYTIWLLPLRTPSLSLLRWSYSYIGLFLTLFFIFSFFEQCILFFIQWLFFYFLKIFKTNRKLLFFDFIKFQKLPC